MLQTNEYIRKRPGLQSLCVWQEVESCPSWLTIAYAIMPVGVVAGKAMTDGAWGDTKNKMIPSTEWGHSSHSVTSAYI